MKRAPGFAFLAFLALWACAQDVSAAGQCPAPEPDGPIGELARNVMTVHRKLSLENATFDAKRFGCLVAMLALKNDDKSAVVKRLSAARKERDRIFSEIGLDHLYHRVVYARSRGHSFPLIDLKKFWDGQEPKLFDSYDNLLKFAGSEGFRLTEERFSSQMKRLLEQSSPEPWRWAGVEDKTHPLHQMQKSFRAGLRVSEPLLLWLLEQKGETVSQEALLRKATEIYQGDVVTALGVIGQLFFSEIVELKDRRKTAVLSSKLLNLHHENSDQLGANYHFWGYLNLALQGDFLAANLMSIAYEGIYSQDADDFSADQLGLFIGQKTRANIEDRNRACRFGYPDLFRDASVVR